MKIRNLWVMAATFVCGALMCVSAQARVCFLPDGDCEKDSAAFQDYGNPYDLCNGFDKSSSSDCSPLGFEQCKFDNKYKCCDDDFVDACDSSARVVEKCGNFYKCECPAEYKYDKENCANPKEPSGDSCALYKMTASGKTQYSTKYKECKCNRSVYPYTKEGCSPKKPDENEKCCEGSTCYYKACKCGSEYECTVSRCPTYGLALAVKEGSSCTMDGITKYKAVGGNCCCDECENGFPYYTSDEAEAAGATDKESCCNGARYRAKDCKPNYVLINGQCVTGTCEHRFKKYAQDKKEKGEWKDVPYIFKAKDGKNVLYDVDDHFISPSAVDKAKVAVVTEDETRIYAGGELKPLEKEKEYVGYIQEEGDNPDTVCERSGYDSGKAVDKNNCVDNSPSCAECTRQYKRRQTNQSGWGGTRINKLYSIQAYFTEVQELSLPEGFENCDGKVTLSTDDNGYITVGIFQPEGGKYLTGNKICDQFFAAYGVKIENANGGTICSGYDIEGTVIKEKCYNELYSGTTQECTYDADS